MNHFDMVDKANHTDSAHREASTIDKTNQPAADSSVPVFSLRSFERKLRWKVPSC